MAKRLLTDRTLKALSPAPKGKREDVMDAVVPGFGVRVTDKADEKGKADQITFILVTRFPGSGNPTRRALGEYGVLTLENARQKARHWHELIQKGVDPRQAEEEQRAAEVDRRANTFGNVAEEFIKRHLAGQRRATVSEREIRKELISRWEKRPIDSITRRDVVAMVDEILDRGAKRQAHNILGHVKTVFNWAINLDLYGIEKSPCDRLKPSSLIGEKATRQRVLDDDEIRAVVNAAGSVGYPYGPLLRMLLLTGQRKAEVAEARWREFDLDKNVWTIPEERFKSGSPHIVPLSKDVIALLATLPRFEKGEFLFTATAGKKAVNGFSKAKEAIDALINAVRDEPLAPWVLHDLRRTVRTRLSSLRVAEPVAEKVIGHAKKGLNRVYDQHQYLDEMREALDLWATRLRAIVDGKSAKVIQLKARTDV